MLLSVAVMVVVIIVRLTVIDQRHVAKVRVILHNIPSLIKPYVELGMLASCFLSTDLWKRNATCYAIMIMGVTNNMSSLSLVIAKKLFDQ